MNTWKQAPMVRILLPFIAGILLAIAFPVYFPEANYLIAALFSLIAIVVLIQKLSMPYKKTAGFGMLINITLVLFAFQLCMLKTNPSSLTHFTRLESKSQQVILRLKDAPQAKPNSLKVIAEVLAIKKEGKWVPAQGKTLVYFEKEEGSHSLNYGDELLLKGRFNEIKPPQNPGEFNFKRFLSFQHIHHQVYVKKNAWTKTGINSGNRIKAASLQLRADLLKIMEDHELKQEELAVASALLLGNHDMLDEGIIAAYSNSGAMHILSVSGLHVGIVYLVFSWMLGFMDSHKKGRFFKALLLLSLLWFYAILTGLSPSVMRAATMFSFIVVATASNRNTNIYNTLAASAFILLAINPFLIMAAGFQLSYLAVVGIVYMQPKISNWLEPKTWMMKQVWAISSVSLAAQIATFPLALFYFHKFPNYFLLTNLFVIPVSTLIIYLGILLFVFAKIPLLAQLLAQGLNATIKGLNQFLYFIEKLPHAIVDGISISALETMLLYGFIISSLFYVARFKFKFLIVSLSLLILGLGAQIREQFQQSKQKRILVYHTSSSAIGFISSNRTVVYTDSIFSRNEKALNRSIKNGWAAMGIKKASIVSTPIRTQQLFIEMPYMQFYDQKMVMITNNRQVHSKGKPVSAPLQVNAVILSNNARVSMEEVLSTYVCQWIVFDASNSFYKIQNWKKECRMLQQAFYSVPDSGAFVMDL